MVSVAVRNTNARNLSLRRGQSYEETNEVLLSEVSVRQCLSAGTTMFAAGVARLACLIRRLAILHDVPRGTSGQSS